MSRAEHWFSGPGRQWGGAIVAFGISSWDIPDGPRLRREMRRSTRLNSPKEVKRWARRHGLDPAGILSAWAELEKTGPGGPPRAKLHIGRYW